MEMERVIYPIKETNT